MNSIFHFRRYEYHSKLQPTCTKPTTVCAATYPPLPQSARIIAKEDINIAVKMFYTVIGRGIFGKCLRTKLGPLDNVCIKVFNNIDDSSMSHFYNEAFMLSNFCHLNIPWLLGVNDGAVKIIVMSFISFCGESLTLFEALYKSKDRSKVLELTSSSWISILTGVANALVYLVRCHSLHNDIKCDNIMLCSHDGTCTGVLIDFGKGCPLKRGRRYHLAPSVQKTYLIKHPQIPPDIVHGRNCQSHASDIYAFGRVIKQVNKEKLSIPLLQSIGDICMEDNSSKRPTAQDIYTSLINLS